MSGQNGVQFMLALAFLLGAEKTGGIFLFLAFSPVMAIMFFSCAKFVECVNFVPVSLPWYLPPLALLVCMCLVTVFVIGFVITAIKNSVS